MTVGTLNPQPEEQLSDILSLRDRRRDLSEPVGSRCRPSVSARRQNRPHKLVVRHVGRHRVADEFVKRLRDVGSALSVLLIAEHGDPLVGKQVGVVSGSQQSVDELIPFVAGVARQKRRDFFRCRQPPRDVDSDSPNERAVIADL